MPAKRQRIFIKYFFREKCWIVKKKKNLSRGENNFHEWVCVGTCTNSGIIAVLSLVPLRWFIPILVDSRLMHLDKSRPEVWVSPQHTRLCLWLDPSGAALTGCSTRLQRHFSHFSRAEVRPGRPQEPLQLQGEHLTIQMFCKVLLKRTKSPLERSSPWGNTLIRGLIHKLQGLRCVWRPWPPPVRCDSGAQGDKTNVNLLDPPAHHKPQSEIGPAPWGCSSRTGLLSTIHIPLQAEDYRGDPQARSD